MFCNNCGAECSPQSTFCTNCGAALAAAAPQPTPQTYTPPTAPYATGAYPYNAPVSVPGKGFGIAGMVLGIISLVFFCLWYIALPCAVVGIILSAVGLNKAKAAGAKNSMAVAGIVCSAIAIGIAIIFLIIVMVTASSLNAMMYDMFSIY